MGDEKISQKNLRQVKVQDSFKEDSGRGRMRIDPKIIKDLNLRKGDVIQIHNPNSGSNTAALLYPGKSEDLGSNSIRIDPSLRRNLGVSLGAIVEIRKIKAIDATNITFAGIEEPVIVRNTTQLAQKLENRVITKDDILIFYAMGRRVTLIVVNYLPKTEAVRIHRNTKIHLSEKTFKEIEQLEETKVRYEDIGGLKKQIQKIREMVELPIKYPELFKRVRLTPSRGILLHGPSGTGKTLLTRAISSKLNANLVMISGSEIINKVYNENKDYLERKFEEAQKYILSIICINDFDLIAGNNNILLGDIERKIFNQLIYLMDKLKVYNNIIVIGETEKIDNIDKALRKVGRFEREIKFDLPNKQERKDIFLTIIDKSALNFDIDFDIIAEKTDKFTGAEINLLIKEIISLALKEKLPIKDLEEELPLNIINTIEIKTDHFLEILKKKEIILSCPECNLRYRKSEEILYCSRCGKKL